MSSCLAIDVVLFQISADMQVTDVTVDTLPGIATGSTDLKGSGKVACLRLRPLDFEES